jgi:hypothetical protein
LVDPINHIIVVMGTEEKSPSKRDPHIMEAANGQIGEIQRYYDLLDSITVQKKISCSTAHLTPKKAETTRHS